MIRYLQIQIIRNYVVLMLHMKTVHLFCAKSLCKKAPSQGYHDRQDRQDLGLVWILHKRTRWRHAGDVAATVGVLPDKILPWWTWPDDWHPRFFFCLRQLIKPSSLRLSKILYQNWRLLTAIVKVVMSKKRRKDVITQ